MNPAHFAAEQLKTIRTLMERATIYRIVVGETAMAAGVLSVVLGGAAMQMAATWNQAGAGAFIGMWTGVLVIVGMINFTLLARQARTRSESVFSSGMRMALRAICPPLMAGCVLSISALCQGGSYQRIVEMWTICYGLALMATGAFSPRSMQWLGAGFLCLGMALCVLDDGVARSDADYRTANAAMSVGFGGLHAAYGLAVMARKAKARTSPAEL